MTIFTSCIDNNDLLISFDDAKYVIISSTPIPDGLYEGGDPLVDTLVTAWNALDPEQQAISIDSAPQESILHHLKIQVQKETVLELFSILVLDKGGCIIEKMMQDNETGTQSTAYCFLTSDDTLREVVIALCDVY